MTGFRMVAMTAALGLTVVAACSTKKDAAPDPMALGEYVESKSDSFPAILYFETHRVSINDRCPVRKTRLNPRMPPVYVNGQPVGFC